jgi:hypothetical protein
VPCLCAIHPKETWFPGSRPRSPDRGPDSARHLSRPGLVNCNRCREKIMRNGGMPQTVRLGVASTTWPP